METILQWAWRAWLRCTSSALRLRSALSAVVCAITIACRAFFAATWRLKDYVDTDRAEVLRATWEYLTGTSSRLQRQPRLVSTHSAR